MYPNTIFLESSKRNLLLVAVLLLAAVMGGITALVPTSVAMIVLAGAIVVTFIVRSPLAGYCLAIASFGLRDLLLIRPADEGPNVHFAEVALLLILSCLVLRGLSQPGQLRISSRFVLITFALALISLWALASVTWSSTPGDSLRQSIRLATALLYIPVALLVIKSERDVRFVLVAWLAAGLIGVGASLAEGAITGRAVEWGPDTGGYIVTRLAGFAGHPNQMGFYLTLSTGWTVGLWLLTSSRLVRMLIALSLVAMAAILVLTFSRGAWVGIVIVAAAFFLVLPIGRRTRIKRWQIWLLTLLILTTVLVAINQFPELNFRFSTFTSLDADAEFLGRINNSQFALETYFLRAPIIGTGLGATAGPLDPHNVYITILAELGIIGAGFFAFLGLVFAHGLWRSLQLEFSGAARSFAARTAFATCLSAAVQIAGAPYLFEAPLWATLALGFAIVLNIKPEPMIPTVEDQRIEIKVPN